MAFISKNIFRAYDIRGVEKPDELSAESFQLLGLAYGTYCMDKNITQVVVGHDSRASSAEFAQSTIQGLIRAGCKVIDLGMVTTPMMYWAQYYFKTKGGFMVTASHNPIGWNGVKVADGFSKVLGGDELLVLYDIITTDQFKEQPGGSVRKETIQDHYIQDLVNRVHIQNKPKILINTGNGTAGLLTKQLFQQAGCEVVEMHAQIDDTYPHYMPNPIDDTMKQDTTQEIQKRNVDFAFSFDGDGDRIGVFDEPGNSISPDYYFLFLVDQMFQDKKNGIVVYDITCSKAVEDRVKELGGESFVCRVGHTFIKQKMQETSADIAIDASGHIFMSHGYYGFDDALYAGLKLCEYFSQQTQPVSKLVEKLPRYVISPRWNFSATVEEKKEIVEAVKQAFEEQGYNIATVDGVKVTFEDGFGLIRPSNTSENIVMRIEAKTQERLNEIQHMFMRHINKPGQPKKELKAI